MRKPWTDRLETARTPTEKRNAGGPNVLRPPAVGAPVPCHAKSITAGGRLTPAAGHHFNKYMIALIVTPMFAAVGYSLIYLLLGGGFGGAVLIFIIAKM